MLACTLLQRAWPHKQACVFDCSAHNFQHCDQRYQQREVVRPYVKTVFSSSASLIRRVAAQSNLAAALDQEPNGWPYLNPLLLAFFASQKRSMFAARCLVETVIELYEQGQQWSDIQLELKLAGIQEGKHIEQLPPDAQEKARLLVDLETDMLLQWIALISMTLKELGAGEGTADLGALDEVSQMGQGMRAFVRQTLDLGYSLERLQLQQQMSGNERGEILPSVALMQENARLIVLTSEVVKGRHREQDGAMAVSTSIGAAQASMLVGDDPQQLAARVLLAFLGAAQGSLYSVNAFLEEILACYRRGLTAQQVFDARSPEDFATGKTLFPVAASKDSSHANAAVFAHWVSAVYITLAQVGVVHPAAGNSLGWAWAGVGDADDDAIAANRLAYLVTSTLKNQAAEEGDAVAAESEAMEAIRGRLPAARQGGISGQYVVMEDPEIRENSSAVALMTQLVNLIQLTRSLASRTMQTSSGH